MGACSLNTLVSCASLVSIVVMNYAGLGALSRKEVNLELSSQFWGSKACHQNQLGSGEHFMVDIRVTETGAGETKTKSKPHDKAGSQRLSQVRLTPSQP